MLPWTDLNDSRRRAVAEYEDVLDSLERFLSEPLAATAGAMRRQTERWTALLHAARESGAFLSSVVRTTEARIGDARAAGRNAALESSLTKRISDARERTAAAAEGLRLRASEAAAETARRRRRRPGPLRHGRGAGTQLDIRV